MKVGLIEVKPLEGGYVAKEMAGGLGKRIKLDKGYIGKVLETRLSAMFSAPPMLLAQIAGICTSFGHEVRAYHTRSVEDVDERTNLAIILGTMVDYQNEIKFASELHDSFPDLSVVFLGSFPTAMPDMFMAGGNHVIKGDPETAVHNILENGLPDEKIVESPRPINLNVLPVPDWEPFIANSYFARRPFSSERGICIQKSRGCSMSCNYCPYAGIYGKANHYDSDYVIDLIKRYRDEHNIRYFMFRDPNFGENRRQFREFMEKLLDLDLDITWSCEARLDTFKSDDDLKLMAQAGLRYIITGIEASDEDLLRKNLRRPIPKEDAVRKLNLLESDGVIVQTNYILGFPEEHEESVYETIEYAKSINSMFATFHVFTPQPGTKIFDQYSDKLLNLDWEEYNYSNLVWDHDTLSKTFLETITANTYSSYYFRYDWFKKHAVKLTKLLL
jgi:anaerobic magnesium-protoporphyrin IX monomethyl ester cyclase